jgi:Protein of unknown function (DUF2865)
MKTLGLWSARRLLCRIATGSMRWAALATVCAVALAGWPTDATAANKGTGNFFNDVMGLFSGQPAPQQRRGSALGQPVRVLGYGTPKRRERKPLNAPAASLGAGGFGGGGFGGSDETTGEETARPRRIGNYRTMCVRLCDGYYWPISNATSSSGVSDDKRTCESSCSSPAKLYVQTDGGSDPATMRSIDGNPYKKLQTAFLYRKAIEPSCRCKADPWSATEEARHMSYAKSSLIGVNNGNPTETSALERRPPPTPAAHADPLGRDPAFAD